ncbi:protein translocase subunit SecD [Pontivivens nitratireducens]|uniref:Protein translocase subunit SecD n=1 Tax=Pontivivens nitratireducens TaxID=2758038 RepID=A0A6G7VMC2_9RHOB|nr:protein translocase subunit SecD [Pontibrevibacter nitratireducens]QIK40998.1 protein translocase subunit SecD [Pontibrevibacter nitratireducens]
MLGYPLWKKIGVVIVCLAALLFSAPNLFYAQVEASNDAVAAGQEGNWPDYLPSDLVNLGLDLRGGAHLLVEVQVEDVYQDRMDGIWPEALRVLREQRDAVGTVRQVDTERGELLLRIGEASGQQTAIEALRELAQPITTLTGIGSTDIEVSAEGTDLIRIRLSDAEKSATDDRTVAQSVEIVRRRIDESGTREPTIQRQGDDRILIQVPGVGSSQEVLDLIGTTAKLGFHHVVSATTDENARPGAGNLLLPSVDEPSSYYIVERRAIVSGDQLVDAQSTFDQNNNAAVSFRFNAQGARIFGDHTAENVGNLFAIVLDDEVVSAPRIQSYIPGGSGIITGRFTTQETANLSILLRAGALPAELVVLEQRTIGPELGADSIEAGRLATMVAFVAVLVFMGLSYGLFGLFANVALILNVAMIFAILSVLGATLTLPGIAGIVLTVGMAVDANVLIFERIREELKSGKGPARAIQLGYDKAFTAILDANITTFIAAVILFVIGSGPVRGFSVTLGVGIVTSVFAALLITRLLIVTWFDLRRPKTIEV